MTTDELRAKFEAQHTCSYGHRRSRRGSYVNPPTQRDWKWFQAGAAVAAKPLEDRIALIIKGNREREAELRSYIR